MINIALLLLMTALRLQTPAAQATTTSTVAPPTAAPAAAGFLIKSLTIASTTYEYSIYVPPEYNAKQAWPVILALHGSGERGSDGLLQTEVGIGTAIRRNRGFFPAIVIMPQCRPHMFWDGPMIEMALKCVEETSREYRLDPDRLYLTGLSLGGAGTWTIASRFADRFAAIVPVCGFIGRPDMAPDQEVLKESARSLAKLPIWCFHGGADPVVKPERSREVIEAIKAVGGSPKYTELPAVGHNSWDEAYRNAELWKWLLAQKRAAAQAPAGG